MPFTLTQVVGMVVNRVKATDITDAESLDVIKNGINAGYMRLSATVDRKIQTSAALPFTNPLPLPADVIDVVEVRHSTQGEIGRMEYQKDGDLLFILPPITGGAATLRYAAFPPRITADDGVFLVKDGYVDALVAYGAYAYQLYTKTYTSAQLFLEEFNGFVGGGAGAGGGAAVG